MGEVLKHGLNSSKYVTGEQGGRRRDTAVEVPDVELPEYFDDSNDPEVFYGFSDDECDPVLQIGGEERVYEWALPPEVEHLFNSDSDESNFEGFEEDER